MAGRWIRSAALGAALILVTGGCWNWSQYRGDPGHSGAQPTKSDINPANVSRLAERWFAAAGGSVGPAPTIFGSFAYVAGADGILYAFDAAGEGCAGTLTSCTPKWTATASAGQALRSSPAVADGVVYVQGRDKLLGFDAKGEGPRCAGAVCSPVWESSSIGDVVASPTVFNKRLYATGATGLNVFDVFNPAATPSTCSSGLPQRCSPIWSSTTFTPTRDASPAVAKVNLSDGVPEVPGERVFVTGDGRLYWFDTAGCGASACAPLRRAENADSAPAVVDGNVYVSSRQMGIAVFRANGIKNCDPSTKVCTPVATTNVSTGAGGGLEPPAVAKGIAYLTLAGTLYAFDATGQTCLGTPKQCTPLWRSAATPAGDGLTGAPALATGVVYAGGEKRLRAYDANGFTNCGPLPKRCEPLWAGTDTTGYSSPVIRDSTIYAGTTNGVHAFMLSDRAPAPRITGILQKLLPVVGASQIVTITGTGFVPGLTVSSTIPNAVLGPLTNISATSFDVKVTVPGTTSPGQYQLRVANPTPDLRSGVGTIVVRSSATASAVATNAGIAPYPGILWDCPAERNADIKAVADAGATWTAFDFDWKSMEGDGGPGDPDAFTRGDCDNGRIQNGGMDAAVLVAKAQGLKIVGIITYSPWWARDNNAPGCEKNVDAGHCFPANEQAVAWYGDFAARAAAHYGPNAPNPALRNSVTAWQLWNEPNQKEYAHPSPDPVRYADMVKDAGPKIIAVNPAATVITGGTAPTDDAFEGMPAVQIRYTPLNWLQRLYDNGAQGSFNAVGHHPYNFPCSPLQDESHNAFLQTAQLHQMMTDHGDAALKVWGTEMGSVTSTDTSGDPSNICLRKAMTEAEQSQSAYDYYKGWNSKPFAAYPDFRTFTGPLIWKATRDSSDDPSHWDENQGLLRFDRSLEPKAAFNMFQQIMSNGAP